MPLCAGNGLGEEHAAYSACMKSSLECSHLAIKIAADKIAMHGSNLFFAKRRFDKIMEQLKS